MLIRDHTFMKFKGCLLPIFLFMSFLGTTLDAQPNRAPVVIKPHQLTDHLYMLEGQGGNIGFLSGPEGVLIVDTQFPHVAPQIIKTVGEMSDGKIQYVLNTHFHGDHTGGNQVIGAGATIIGHNKVRERLEASDRTPDGALPTITYTSQMSLNFGGEEIHMIHLGPGHTDTDSVIYFKSSNALHMGDLFFNGRFPYIDLNSGGSVSGYLSNIKKVLGMTNQETKIIPGHGQLASREDLVSFINMFDDCFQAVSKAKAEGQTLEEVTKAGLPKKYEEWGKAFINEERWISFLYAGS